MSNHPQSGRIVAVDGRRRASIAWCVRPDQALRAALVAREGIVSRAQLLAAGVSASSIARRVQAGDLLMIVPGVYRAATTALTAGLRLRAIAMRLPHAVITGRWSAWWHGLADQPRCAVTVIVPPGASRPSWPGLVVLRRPLERADRMMLRRLPVTTRARTVLDCADGADGEDIRDRALQRGTTILSLQTALQRMAPGRGTTAARRLLEPIRRVGVSPPERDLRRSLTQASDSGWRCGVWVWAGAREYWLDLAIEEIKLAVEVDGWQVHSRSDAFHTDRERRNALTSAGWIVLQYTPRRLRNDMAGVLAEIRHMEAKLIANRPQRR